MAWSLFWHCEHQKIEKVDNSHVGHTCYRYNTSLTTLGQDSSSTGDCCGALGAADMVRGKWTKSNTGPLPLVQVSVSAGLSPSRSTRARENKKYYFQKYYLCDRGAT